MCVPGTGLEPAPPYGDYTLNVARLPISPSGQNIIANYELIITNEIIKRTYYENKSV